ncbi:MAG: protein-export chaperone SecB [Proteobacteria bacterium]|nr:protein-export chaperone SecB [Pseudomonadota bacterium]
MAEEPNNKQNTEQFVIQNVYIKDVSFETPNSPQIFMEKWKPKLELEISNDIKQLNDELFEIVLNITATVKIEEKTAFLVEVHQAGLFAIKGFPNDKMSYMLNAYCPNVLFPFARETVANLVIKGGFQPLWLSPINFDALYTQQLQKQQDQKTQQPSTDTIN